MAREKHAYGYCDRTGFRYPLKDLVPQIIDGIDSGLLVGKDMVDIDHEQLRLDEVDASDKISLDDPRPDTTIDESRELWAWEPVGGGLTPFGSRTVGLDVSAVVGKVTVETT